jgi:hypothetical protein
MRKIAALSVAVLFAVSLAAPCLAQDQKPDAKAGPRPATDDYHYYRLDFVLREVGEDGKVANSRAYSIIVGADDKNPAYIPPASIRTGSRIPVGAKSNYEYRDIGVNIDCREVHLVQETGRADQIALRVGADISSIAGVSTDASEIPGDGTPPVLRQNKWDSIVMLPLNKPTVLYSSDNVSSKGKLQLELTATPVR